MPKRSLPIAPIITKTQPPRRQPQAPVMKRQATIAGRDPSNGRFLKPNRPEQPPGTAMAPVINHATKNLPESRINNQVGFPDSHQQPGRINSQVAAGFGFANAYPSNAPGSRCI